MSPQVSSLGDVARRPPFAIVAKRRRSGPSGGSAAIRSMPAKRSNASATVSRSGAANGSAMRSRNDELPGARGLRRAGQHRHAVVHQQLVGLVRAVPFEHGEFGMMQRAALAVAERSGRTRRSAARRRPAASCRRIPARCAGSAGRGRPATTSSVRMAWRWVSLPGETCSVAVSTSTNSRSANKSRNARGDSAPARAGTAGGRHGHRGPRNGGDWPSERVPEAAKIAGGRAQDQYVAPRHVGRPASGRPPIAQTRMHVRESHRQLAPQRQYPRTRRR